MLQGVLAVIAAENPWIELTVGRGKRAAEKQREKEERDQESQQKKEIQAAYKEVKNDIYPSRPDEMEQFFLAEISQAETVVTQGIPPPEPVPHKFFS